MQGGVFLHRVCVVVNALVTRSCHSETPRLHVTQFGSSQDVGRDTEKLQMNSCWVEAWWRCGAAGWRCGVPKMLPPKVEPR